MYIKVLYNIKSNKKIRRGGGIFEPKTLSFYIKKERIDRDRIRTHDLQVRKPALLSTRLKHFDSNYKI